MRTLNQYLNDGVPSPSSGESLETFLTRLDLLDHGFSYRELVKSRLSRKFAMPPRHAWIHFAMVLRVAIAFRERAIAEAGVRGLKVAAAYRPSGGASRSAHKSAKALDLDRIGGDAKAYYQCAAEFWAEYGPRCGMGLGFYTWSTTSLGGIRVHLDAGHFAGLRTWQGVRSRFLRPWKGKPLARKLLADAGIPDPMALVRS